MAFDAALKPDLAAGLIRTRIVAAQVEAEDVVSLTLRGIDRPLPDWQPGAHVDLHLPNGMVRQYSLCGAGSDWRIAVLCQPQGRGGSIAVHGLRAGDMLTVSTPRNLFPMMQAAKYLFIAGGIGITPILAMLRRAQALGADWRLIYLGRNRNRMAFTQELAALDPFRVEFVQTDLQGIPAAEDLARRGAGAQTYACGPSGLLSALETAFAAQGRAADLHLERFEASTTAKPEDGTVRLHLARQGRFVDVPAGISLLDGLRAQGVEIASSCEQGFCGTCECRVLNGTPDHRDTLLSDAERARGDVMLPCVSRAMGNELTLDL